MAKMKTKMENNGGNQMLDALKKALREDVKVPRSLRILAGEGGILIPLQLVVRIQEGLLRLPQHPELDWKHIGDTTQIYLGGTLICEVEGDKIVFPEDEDEDLILTLSDMTAAAVAILIDEYFRQWREIFELENRAAEYERVLGEIYREVKHYRHVIGGVEDEDVAWAEEEE